MKKNVRMALDYLLGVGVVIAGFAGIVLTVKICWAFVEFIWKLW